MARKYDELTSLGFVQNMPIFNPRNSVNVNNSPQEFKNNFIIIPRLDLNGQGNTKNKQRDITLILSPSNNIRHGRTNRSYKNEVTISIQIRKIEPKQAFGVSKDVQNRGALHPPLVRTRKKMPRRLYNTKIQTNHSSYMPALPVEGNKKHARLHPVKYSIHLA